MPANNKRVGSPLMQETDDSEKLTLTKKELNEMISSAVSAAIIASVNAPQRPVAPESKSSRLALEQDFNNRMLTNNRLAKVFSEERKVPYSIPSIYSTYIGYVTASINGLTVKIPADGKTYYIPERFVPVIQQYVENVDRKVATMDITRSIDRGGIVEIRGIL